MPDTTDINRVIAVRSINTSSINIVRAIVRQRQRPVKVQTQSYGHAWVIGHPVNGKLGTYNGVDGNQITVGQNGLGTLSTLEVSNYNNIYYENFDTTKYIDTSETTATVNTTLGQVEF